LASWTTQRDGLAAQTKTTAGGSRLGGLAINEQQANGSSVRARHCSSSERLRRKSRQLREFEAALITAQEKPRDFFVSNFCTREIRTDRIVIQDHGFGDAARFAERFWRCRFLREEV